MAFNQYLVTLAKFIRGLRGLAVSIETMPATLRDLVYYTQPESRLPGVEIFESGVTPKYAIYPISRHAFHWNSRRSIASAQIIS